MERIDIIGGGLSGSLMAVYLAKRGFDVHVFERRPDLRSNRISAGKSINLALSNRGIKALEKVGLADEILSDGIPMYGRMMHSIDGKLSYQPYGKEGQAIYSVSRGRLNIKLLELADEYPNITLYFNHRCVDVDIVNGTSTFVDEHGNTTHHKANRILGTDGAFAATRGRLQISDRFNYSQDYLKHGYKELAIPAGEGGKFLIEKNALHIWPCGRFHLYAFLTV
jgi:kynurenine 3-monooxygenase